MDIKNEMHLEFMALSQNESFARVVVGAFATQLNPTLDELSDIKTAVSEAVTNAIVHGYENNGGLVNVNCRLYETMIEIEIVDKGKGIENVQAAREPFYTTIPGEERSGMGFTVMETFMDDVLVESKLLEGTKVILKKTIDHRESQGD